VERDGWMVLAMRPPTLTLPHKGEGDQTSGRESVAKVSPRTPSPLMGEGQGGGAG